MKKFSWILFDVDGTLLDFHKTEKEALTNTFNAIGIKASEENINLYSEINIKLWEDLELGKIDKEKLKTERFRLFFDKVNVALDVKKASDIYINSLAESFFYVNGAEEACKTLKETHNLAIVTNGLAKVQHSRIKKSGLDKYFEHIFISDEIGFPKPKIEFFNHVFKNINYMDLSEIIIIGDSLTSDMKGGNNANIATCWFNPMEKANNSDSVCDFEIRTLDELLEIVN